MKKSTKQSIAVGCAITLVLILAFVAVYNVHTIQIKDAYEIKIQEKEQFLDKKRRVVYVPTKKIKPGVMITRNNTQKIVYYSDSEQKEFFSDRDLGSTALITLNKDTPIFKNMITENVVSDSLREQEFTEINLSTNLQEDDSIDVRIVFPNGESYVVLSKKVVKQLAVEKNGCYIDLNAEELDRVQSAFVDAYLNKATLYTVKYIQSSLQDPSIVNYTPSVDVIELIESDPNIVSISSKYLSESARNSLETRLNTFREVLANRQLEEKQQEKEILDLENQDEDELEDESLSLDEETSNEDELVVDTETTNEEGVEFID